MRLVNLSGGRMGLELTEAEHELNRRTFDLAAIPIATTAGRLVLVGFLVDARKLVGIFDAGTGEVLTDTFTERERDELLEAAMNAPYMPPAARA